MNIGERIKKLREEKGLSQTELANMVGITKQSLYKYENSIITNIPSSKIESIANKLETTPAYLMGWEDKPIPDKFPAPNITEDYVTFPVIGEIAAGYDKIAIEDWSGETVDVPTKFLKGRKKSDFFVLTVTGDSMYPIYHNGDKVLILKQATLNRPGDVGAILCDDEIATLKRVAYVPGEDWLELIPINPEFKPQRIEGEHLEHCRVIGVPRLLIREIK